MIGSAMSAFVQRVERRHRRDRRLERAGVAKSLEILLGGRGGDQRAERSVVAGERRERRVAEVAARAGHRRPVRQRLTVADAVVAAVVDDRAVGRALGHAAVRRSPRSIRGVGRAAPHRVDHEVRHRSCRSSSRRRSTVGARASFRSPRDGEETGHSRGADTVTPFSAATARRSAHSMSGRRTARNARSTSSGSGSPLIFGRRSRSHAPAAISAS